MDLPCRHSFVRFTLLGAKVDALTTADLFAVISENIAQKSKFLIGNHNLHSLYLYRRSEVLRAYYERADIIEIDSMPLIAWAKLLGFKVSRANRITYLDYRESFWRLAEDRGWIVYHAGGHPDTLLPAKTNLLARYPRLKLYQHTGYFNIKGEENQRLLADIAEKTPDILFIGMGMPRQELWIEDNYDALPKCVILPVGAAFDYEAGAQYEPPRWMGQWGVEWLARFVNDPKRLFERYFLEPWSLIPAAFGDIWRRMRVRALSL